MIDWLTFCAPLAHDTGLRGPFFAGCVLSTVPDPSSELGEVKEWEILKRKSLPGSWSSTIQVRSQATDSGLPGIWISGNPAKWLQGHNIFGSSDIWGLVFEMLERACAAVGVVPTEADRALWRAGEIDMLRVDVTESFDLGNVGRVRAALRAMDSSAQYKQRGRGIFKGDSLIFGKGSRRWSLTFYAKGPELDIPKHGFPRPPWPIPAFQQLYDFGQGLLRAEFRLQRMHLKKEHLHMLHHWGENQAVQLHRDMLGLLEVAGATMIDPETLEGLPGRLQGVYQLWKDGHDLRRMYPKNTFYRYRRELLAVGVDILVQQERKGPDMSNVVPINAVIHCYPATIPEWAKGTPFYFEPQRRSA